MKTNQRTAELRKLIVRYFTTLDEYEDAKRAQYGLRGKKRDAAFDRAYDLSRKLTELEEDLRAAGRTGEVDL